jgi:minichromosome maintenance protein 10
MKADLKAKLAAKAKQKAESKIQVPSTPPRRHGPSQAEESRLVPPSTPPSSRKHDTGTSATTPERTPTSAAKLQASPSRILLGLDKGTKAANVSLARPPKAVSNGVTSPSRSKKVARPLTFAERLDQARRKEVETADWNQTLQKLRRQGFSMKSNVGASESDKTSAVNDTVIVDEHSRLRLIKRYLDEETLSKVLKDVHPMNIPNVYAEVTYPDYREPQYPNYVVFGIVAKKGDVKQSRIGKKYVMLTLTDLQYDIALAVHGDALERFWKIRVGTLIAVLNPGIYKTKRDGEPITIGLTVSDTSDVILEVGLAKDLGTCSAMTSKGTQCTNWVNSLRNTYCEFHAEVALKRARSQRQEVNSAPTKMFSPRKNGQRLAMYSGGSVNEKQGLLPDPFAPQYHDGSRIYTSGKNIPTDDYDEYTPEAKASRLAKRLKTIEREQEIRKILAQRPGGHLLREYDAKGQLVDADSGAPACPTSPGRLFTPQHIRKIGFDPTKRKELAKEREIGKVSASQVSLTKPRTTTNDSSDDDLDII